MSAMRTPSLPELQDRLQALLTDSQGMDAALSRSLPNAQVLPWISGGAAADARARLSVYADAYFLRLLESLGHDFPALKRALGDDDFRRLAADYLKKNPSTFKNVALVGERLPAFLGRHPLSRALKFLPDLARLEWEVLSALYRDRPAKPDFSRPHSGMEEISSSIKLSLNPAARLLETKWAVDRLWRRRDIAMGRGLRRLREREPRRLLVFRDESWVRVEALSPAEWSALKKIEKGAALESVCRHWENSPDLRVRPAAAQKWFSHWVRAGIIVIGR